jgi:NAD(P)H-hydrate epimerase
MKVATVDQMRSLDERAISDFAIPDHILMENAGEAVYYLILRELGIAGRRFAVICGLGNNGGDGLVVARKIHSSGGIPEVFVLGDPDKYGESSAMHFRMLAQSGVSIVSDPPPKTLAMGIAHSDAVIDAIFGTGITRDVEGRYVEIVETINASDRPVIAIDIPSGVDGNTGKIRGVAVQADWTVTFGLPKRGNLLYPGAGLGGRLVVTHISFPRKLQETEEIEVALNAPPPLPPRRIDGHKGSFGDVLFIAGASSYYGAPVFSALAGLGGEIVFAPQNETKSGSLSLKAADSLLELSGEVDFVVLGPGLSLADETQRLVRKLTSRIEKALLVDGDGLTALSSEPEVIEYRAGATILTPHPGEMARILGRTIEEIQADPVDAVQIAATSLGATVVLKGAHSLIGYPDRRVLVNTSGNSGMATAGSGDVLTGTIAAMHGLGQTIDDAVRSGVFMHGLAGDLAADEKGEDGITARDILEQLPAATMAYREDYDEIMANHYGAVEVI